jgi:hypothetical protein
VYWVGAGLDPLVASKFVMKVPRGGGAATTLASGQNGGWGPAVDAHDVYWADVVTIQAGGAQGPGTVMTVPLDGSSSPAVFASGQAWAGVVAVDATSVYWGGGTLDSDDSTSVDPGAVMRSSVGGGAPEMIFPASVIFNGLILCPGGVCWSDAAAGTVMRFTACSP